MEQAQILQIAISLLGIAGFFLANYIRRKKTHGEELVCPIGTSCTRVVTSEHSKIMGIRIEILGMFYYGLIALLYAAIFFYPAFATDVITAGILGITVAAFAFSAYLTILQAFIIKEWCTWCIISAGLCTAIFFCALRAWSIA